MKKEELFEGAIVLARSSIYERRSRWKVLEVGDSLVKIKKDNLTMYTGIRHLRPARITPKSLMELGFKSKVTYCNLYGVMRSEKGAFCLQYIYDGPEDIRITLKGDCKLWSSNVMFDDRCNISKMHSVSYIHEVQKIIKNQQS